jgi:formamidopyrimidine-DNA glycosylase
VPELPEVEFCARALRRWGHGRRVVDVVLHDPRVVRSTRTDRPTAGRPDGWVALRGVVAGEACGAVERHGKRLLWHFGAHALLLHLGMTGKWSHVSRGVVPRFARVSLQLDDGSDVVFEDPRLLGGIVPTDAVAGAVLLAEGLGPDALGGPLPRCGGERPIKVALMDQALVAGVGNVQAMEALWRAHLHPALPCSALTPAQWATLDAALQAQLLHTLDLLGDGDTITYVEESRASNPFAIYRREGAPCPACGTAIRRMIQAGRSTYWCPTCQPSLEGAARP